jgi:hypothetical protein
MKAIDFIRREIPQHKSGIIPVDQEGGIVTYLHNILEGKATSTLTLSVGSADYLISDLVEKFKAENAKPKKETKAKFEPENAAPQPD